MGRRALSQVDGFMRLGHLYTGLLLAPWMAVYAISAFCLNHDELFGRPYVPMDRWEIVQEVKFVADDAFPRDPAERAGSILRQIDLDGPHRILGEPTENEMVIYRLSVHGDYRITWRRSDARIVVQRRPFSIYNSFHFLHFGRGYDWRYFRSVVWAFSVDAVIASTWFLHTAKKYRRVPCAQPTPPDCNRGAFRRMECSTVTPVRAASPRAVRESGCDR